MAEVPTAEALGTALGQFDGLHDLKQRLDQGDGFVIGRRADLGVLGVEAVWTQLENIARTLGRPLPQDEAGGIRHVIRSDEISSMLSQRIFPTDDREFEYHTDGSYLVGENAVRYVLLYCSSSALRGGETLILHGGDVARWVALRHPDSYARLCSPVSFQVDRQLVGAPSSPTIVEAAFGGDGDEPHIRIHRWRMYQASGADAVTQQALDALGMAFDSVQPIAQFTLQRGDLLILNNTRVLHARTAYEDHPSTERKRTILRLWVG